MAADSPLASSALYDGRWPLGTEGLDDVDASGARCRQHRGDHSRTKQHEGRNDHGQRSRHSQIAKIAAGHARRAVAKRGSCQHADCGYDDALRDHASQ